MANQFNLRDGQRAERKLLLTVVEWQDTPQDFYILQTEEPSDWSTNFTSYYTKNSSGEYEAVTGSTAPTWQAMTYYTKVTKSQFREIVGTRIEDSSIEYNLDSSTTTDIRGNNYTDINKTQPSQALDNYPILGGSLLGAFINDIRKRNALSELQQFTCYIITAYVGNSTSGYEAEKHTGCTISYDSLGGSDYINMGLTINFSNKITNGTVDKLSDDFTFTADVSV